MKLIPIILTLNLILCQLTANPIIHNWKSKAGTELEASLHKLDGDYVFLKKTSDGKIIKLPINQLSDDDQEYLKSSPFSHHKGNLYTEDYGSIIILKKEGAAKFLNSSTNEEIQPNIGDTITEGSHIKTGSNGEVILLFSNGNTTHIHANSEFRILRFRQEKIEKTGKIHTDENELSPSNTKLKLYYGSIIGNIKKLDARSSYSIETNHGAAGIRGTDIHLTSSEDYTSFSVLDGLAEFWNEQVGTLSIGHEKNVEVNQQNFVTKEIDSEVKNKMNSSKEHSHSLSKEIDIQKVIDSIFESNTLKANTIKDLEVIDDLPLPTNSRSLKEWLAGTEWEIQNQDQQKIPDMQMRRPGIRDESHNPHAPSIRFMTDEIVQMGMGSQEKFEAKSKKKLEIFHGGKAPRGEKMVKNWIIEFSDDYQTITAENLFKKETIIAKFKRRVSK